jgi:hypothetical protein
MSRHLIPLCLIITSWFPLPLFPYYVVAQQLPWINHFTAQICNAQQNLKTKIGIEVAEANSSIHGSSHVASSPVRAHAPTHYSRQQYNSKDYQGFGKCILISVSLRNRLTLSQTGHTSMLPIVLVAIAGITSHFSPTSIMSLVLCSTPVNPRVQHDHQNQTLYLHPMRAMEPRCDSTTKLARETKTYSYLTRLNTNKTCRI